MRERLIAALVGMTVAMIGLYGIPRAYILADLVSEYETQKVTRSAVGLSAMVGEREKNGSPIDEEFLSGFLREGETLTYEAADGSVVTAGPIPDLSEDIVASRPVAGGGTLTMSRADDVIEDRITEALVPLITIGLLLIVLAATTGYLIAQRLSRPLIALATAAGRVGTDRFDVDPPRSNIPEMAAIGDALRLSSQRISELVRREREFASNASHQLRTPITALRLAIEDLTLWPQTPPEIADELNRYLPELDRLSSAIDEMLGLARGLRLGDAAEVDLSELVADVVERWEPAVRGAGHEIRHDDEGPVTARIVTGPVVQILDVLIDNACSHGSGLIRVRAQDVGKYVRIEVGDEGARTIGQEVFQRGTTRKDAGEGGLGLAIAAELATTMGGYLKLTDDDRTTFELLLPGPGD